MITNVGELRAALDAFPDDMPVVAAGHDGFGEWGLSDDFWLHTIAETPIGDDLWAGTVSDDFAKVITAYGSYVKI